MNRILKLALVAKLVLVAALFVFNGSANAQSKFGYINYQELLPLMPEFDSAQVKLNTLGEELQKQLGELNEELNQKYQKYQKEQATYTASMKTQKEKELQDLNTRLQEFQQDAQADFEAVREQLMVPVLNKAKEAVKKVASSGGFTGIFDSSLGVLIYYDEKAMTDIMPLVKTELKIKK